MMAEKFRLLLKTISGEINKHNLSNSARITINNVTDKAHGKWNDIENTVTAKYDVIAKKVVKNIILQNLNTAKLEPYVLPERISLVLPKIVMKWWKLYQRLTGLDKTEMARHQVTIAQDILFKCQDKRRNLNREAQIINNKLNEVYSDLIRTRRDESKYVDLTIMENKTLQDQTRIASELNLLDKEEKEHFTVLTTSIKEYHVNQTISAQKFKYLSIITSAAVAIISLICSIIYDNRRNAHIRDIIAMGNKENEETLQNILNSIENIVNTKLGNQPDNEQKQPAYIWVMYGTAKNALCKIFGYTTISQ